MSPLQLFIIRLEKKITITEIIYKSKCCFLNFSSAHVSPSRLIQKKGKNTQEIRKREKLFNYMIIMI